MNIEWPAIVSDVRKYWICARAYDLHNFKIYSGPHSRKIVTYYASHSLLVCRVVYAKKRKAGLQGRSLGVGNKSYANTMFIWYWQYTSNQSDINVQFQAYVFLGWGRYQYWGSLKSVFY